MAPPESGPWTAWHTQVLLWALVLAAYKPTLRALAGMAWQHPLAEHTPFVILLAGYFAYTRRPPKTAGPPCPAAGALACVAGGCLGASLGTLLDVGLLIQWSLPLTLAGITGLLYGPDALRRVRFPLAFLLFAFPLPGKVYLELIGPLQLGVSAAAAWVLQHLGYGVIRSGNVLTLGSLHLGVTTACAGVGSLQTMLALAVFGARVRLRTLAVRLAVILAILPTVLTANVLRVVSLAILALRYSERLAFGESHALWGLLVFAVCLSALLGLLATGRRWEAGARA